MEAVKKLMQWYSEQCNGLWEHRFGVSIESTDNPGWWVKIDIPATLAPEPVDTILTQNGMPSSEGTVTKVSPEWIVCRIHNGQFDGAGDPGSLVRIIEVFMEFVELKSSNN